MSKDLLFGDIDEAFLSVDRRYPEYITIENVWRNYPIPIDFEELVIKGLNHESLHCVFDTMGLEYLNLYLDSFYRTIRNTTDRGRGLDIFRIIGDYGILEDCWLDSLYLR